MIFTTNRNMAKRLGSCFLLEKNGWDDYSYKTLFVLSVFVDGEESEIGPVKIMSPDLDDDSYFQDASKKNTSTKLPEKFETLSIGHYSLGQQLEYYRNLSKLDRRVSEELLHAIKDCAVFYPPTEEIENHKAFWDSLIRGSEAKKCLLEGKDYYNNEEESSKIEFSYSGGVFENSNSSIHFEFDIYQELPSTINVIIGRNGSGKTRLLSKLTNDIIKGRGNEGFYPRRPPISRVVAISYSAFDDFKIPSKEDLLFLKGDYKYIGIRKKVSGSYVIKNSDDHWRDVQSSISVIEDKNLINEIVEFINVSTNECVDGLGDLSEVEKLFSRMSSGQKISLSILCQLSAFLEDDSLVLFDEPENHLHPGLLWKLMVSFDKILKMKKSFSIVATHSPIILQQIPSQYVNVIRKFGDIVTAEKLTDECFGDNLQSIMEKSFGFVELEYDYRHVLRELFESGKSRDEIETMFEKSLSLQARAFLSTIFKKVSDD
ncbi:MAG: AAA family ATPase [Psychrobacter sp.]